ncbi:MAG: hypothetical protein V3T84_11055 [Phycisphaerales bacterium]
MSMIRRRLMLGIGAALLVGGWGATRYAAQHQRAYSYYRSDAVCQRTVYIGGVVTMAIGAGFIGFAVLRHTNRKDE